MKLPKWKELLKVTNNAGLPIWIGIDENNNWRLYSPRKDLRAYKFFNRTYAIQEAARLALESFKDVKYKKYIEEWNNKCYQYERLARS